MEVDVYPCVCVQLYEEIWASSYASSWGGVNDEAKKERSNQSMVAFDDSDGE